LFLDGPAWLSKRMQETPRRRRTHTRNVNAIHAAFVLPQIKISTWYSATTRSRAVIAKLAPKLPCIFNSIR
jgi:hypothetical protein